MASIQDIPDFAGLPGQRPRYAAPADVEPIPVVLVNLPLDPGYSCIAIDRAAVDTAIGAEIAAGRAYQTTVERWSPWSDLTIELPYPVAVGYNYGRFTIGGRRFYAFIDAVYLNLTTTLYNVTRDIWTTYDLRVGYSLITRSHLGVAASADDPYGNLTMTAPEGLDAEPVRAIASAPLFDGDPASWRVVVISANDLRGNGTITPFFERHGMETPIFTADQLATRATEGALGGVPQWTVDRGNYPWQSFVARTGDIAGQPPHGAVPAQFLANLVDSAPTVQAEKATAAAYAALKADHPEAYVTGAAAGYWDTALSISIHANPGAYGISPSEAANLAPIGASPHELGTRINFHNISAAVAAEYGFSAFNSYTFDYTGVKSWDVAAVADTYSLYVPLVTPSPVSTVDGIPAGGGVYAFTIAGWAQYTAQMSNAPWILAGISDIRLVPAWSIGSAGNGTYLNALPPRDPVDGGWGAAALIPVLIEQLDTLTATANVLANWRDTAAAQLGLGPYRKLLTSPYTSIVLSDGETRAEYRPEVWTIPNVQLRLVAGGTHGDAEVRAIPIGYTPYGDELSLSVAFGGNGGMLSEGWAIGAANTAQQDLSLWSNAFTNDNMRDVLIKQMNLAITLGLEQANMAIGLQGVNTVIGSITGGVQGALGGGGASGAIQGAAGAALGGLGGLITTAIQASNNMELLDVSQEGSIDIATYQNGISAVMALRNFDTWVQSLNALPGQSIPHRILGAWRAVLNRGINALIIVPPDDAVRRALALWKRTGYAVGRALTPSRLDVMTHYSYWQTDGATILGAAPATDRETIARAFDRGLTVWNAVAEIGTDVSDANQPRPGIHY